MAEDEKDKYLKQVNNEIEQFHGLLGSEMERVGSLPDEEKQDAALKLKNLADIGKATLRRRYFVADQGINPGEFNKEPQEGEGALNYILGSLTKPLSAVAQGTQSLFSNDDEKTQQLRADALKNATPFYETITGERVAKSGFTDVLKEAGVDELGSLSQAAPSLFSDTGEGLPLQKGGLFDVTGRGTIGTGLDVALDPLNFIPVGKGVKLAGALADDAFKGLTGKAIREAAYDSPLIKQVARGFNKFAFLARDPAKQEILENLFIKAGDDISNIGPETFQEIAHLFDDTRALKDPAVFNKLQDLDDLSTSLGTEGVEAVSNKYPKLAKSVLENGNGDPKALEAAFLANSGLSEGQVATAKIVRNYFDDLTASKIKDLGISSDALRTNYMPRQMVDLRRLDDLAPDVLAKAPPETRAVIERMMQNNAEAKANAMANLDVNKAVHANTINQPFGLNSRVFKNFNEASNYAKFMGGRIVNDMGELMYNAATKQKKAIVSQDLTRDLVGIFGTDLPPEVTSTFKQLTEGGPRGPEALESLKKVWNKNFLQPLKYSITMPFPAYHVRNIIDDTFRGWEQFGTKWLNPIHSSEAGDIIKAGTEAGKISNDAAQILFQGHKNIDLGNGITMPADKLFEQFTNLGAYKHTLSRADLDKGVSQLGTKISQMDEPIRSTMRKVWENLPTNETFALKFNNHARLKGALIGVKDAIQDLGLKAGDDLSEAFLKGAKASKRAFIDTADLGPIDDALAQFIPFYRFSRKNIPFQASTLINNPQRISKIGIAANNFQTDNLSPEDQKYLSPFLKDSLKISLGDDVNGNHLTLSGLGLSIEDINNYFSTNGVADTIRKITVGQAAPPIQFIYGLISNKHPFFGNELDDFRSRQTYKAFYDNSFIKEAVGGITRTPEKREDGKLIYRYELDNPKQYFAITNAVTPFLSAAAAQVLPGPLAPLSGAVTARGLQAYGSSQDDRKEPLVRALKHFSGMTLSSSDIERNKVNQLLEAYKEQYGIIKRESSRLKAYYKLGTSLAEEEKDNENESSNDE